MLPVYPMPVNAGDTTFMVISTALVALMTPGLAFFYGGLVEKKNSVTIMLQSFVAFAIVTIMWIFGGFSLVFGDSVSLKKSDSPCGLHHAQAASLSLQ